MVKEQFGYIKNDEISKKFQIKKDEFLKILTYLKKVLREKYNKSFSYYMQQNITGIVRSLKPTNLEEYDNNQIFEVIRS